MMVKFTPAVAAPAILCSGMETDVIIFMTLGIIVAAAVVWWNYRRSNEILTRWAAQNGFRILQADMRYLMKGPFTWSAGKGQRVFHVEVMDNQGVRRTGWVRCGSWWWGLFSDQVEVRWDS
jgi:hypothetical protein